MVRFRFGSRHYQSGPGAALGVAAFGLCFMAIICVAGWGAYEGHQKQRRAAEVYLPVSAEVLRSEVEVARSPRGSGSDRETTINYTPKFRYRYTVDGKTYESTQYAYFHESSEGVIRGAVASRPVGSTTTAYYDPDDPAEAVLHREPASGFFVVVVLGFLFLISLIFTVIGFAMYAAERKKRRQVREGNPGQDPCPHCGMTYAFDGQYCRHCRRVK